MGATTSTNYPSQNMSTTSSCNHQSTLKTSRSEQRLLTLREYQQQRAKQSSNNISTDTATAVIRNSSAPALCLASRSSSSSSNLSSSASSSSSSLSHHSSPRNTQRRMRYTSQSVHPQFQCTNCKSTRNIVSYNNNNHSTPSFSSTTSTVLSSPSTCPIYPSSDPCGTWNENFCNRDCYYSYCFRLAEELDCTADDIIEANYHSINGYYGTQDQTMMSVDEHDTYVDPSFHPQQTTQRRLRIH